MSEGSVNEWCMKPLHSLAQVLSGGTPSRYVAEFWEEGTIPWVTPTDLTGTAGRFLSDTRECITARGLNSCSATLLPVGTILMTSRATLGEIRIATNQVCTNQGFKNLVPLPGTHGPFLYYQLSHNKERYRALGIGSTFLEVNKRDTVRFEVLVPPTLDQQYQIAEILSTVDEAIEQTETLIAKMQQIKAGLMHDLFTRGVTKDGQLRPPREEAPYLYKESPLGWIPKEWEHGILNDIISPARPIVYGILMPGQGVPGGVPVIKVKDIIDGIVNDDDLLLTSQDIDEEYQRSKLKKGDILLTIRGTVGRLALVPPHLDQANITQDTARIGVVLGYPEFYRFYLETDQPRQYFAVNTLGVAVQGINLRDVRMTPVPIPQIIEQFSIAQRLKNAIETIRANEKSLGKLLNTKKGLMHDLLTGRVRVKTKSLPPTKSAHV